MKKSVIVSLFTSLLLMTSCVKEYYTYEEGVTMQSYSVVCYSDRWSKTDFKEGVEGCLMFQEFDFPEIDPYLLENGAVLVYYIDSEGTGSDNMLPYVLPYAEPRQTIVENVRAEVWNGKLTIIVERSDFLTTNKLYDMYFKVVILDNFQQNNKKSR